MAKMTRKDRVQAAINMAVSYGGIDGGHHKAWVIDQMVRLLTDCEYETVEAEDYKGNKYTYDKLNEGKKYKKLVADACNGEDGPDTYEWDIGCPP